VNTKQGARIILAGRLLHPDLPIEKGRTLREENRKGRQPRINHLKLCGVARAPTIGKIRKNHPNLINQARMGRNRNDWGIDNAESLVSG